MLGKQAVVAAGIGARRQLREHLLSLLWIGLLLWDFLSTHAEMGVRAPSACRMNNPLRSSCKRQGVATLISWQRHPQGAAAHFQSPLPKIIRAKSCRSTASHTTEVAQPQHTWHQSGDLKLRNHVELFCIPVVEGCHQILGTLQVHLSVILPHPSTIVAVPRQLQHHQIGKGLRGIESAAKETTNN